jgi:hypothetical protein
LLHHRADFIDDDARSDRFQIFFLKNSDDSVVIKAVQILDTALLPAARSDLANFGYEHIELFVSHCKKKINATSIKHEWLEIKFSFLTS